MPITITRDQLTDMDPCDLDARLALFGKRKRLSVTQALKAGATTRDILWVAGRLGLCDQLVTFARGCADAADAADAAYAAATDAAYAADAAADAAAAAAAYAAADAAQQAEIARQHAHLIELF